MIALDAWQQRRLNQIWRENMAERMQEFDVDMEAPVGERMAEVQVVSRPGVPEPAFFPRSGSAAFLKSSDEFGVLQNMCRGMPIRVNDAVAPSSEALYQALKFWSPDHQRAILEAPNGFAAKRLAETLPGYRDMEEVDTIGIMGYVLKLKLLQNQETLVPVLRRTANLPIVEVSYKDGLWGARPSADGRGYVGRNVLGLLWMDLRAAAEARDWNLRGITVRPPQDVCMFGHYIEPYVS